MNQWKFYQAIIAECQKRNKEWSSSTQEEREKLFNLVYDELSNDEDLILDCLAD